jgi:hypothetical protein
MGSQRLCLRAAEPFGRRGWIKHGAGWGRVQRSASPRQPVRESLESVCAMQGVSSHCSSEGHLRGLATRCITPCVPGLSLGFAPEGDDARSRPPQPHCDDTSRSARGAPLLRLGRGARDPLVLDTRAFSRSGDVRGTSKRAAADRTIAADHYLARVGPTTPKPLSWLRSIKPKRAAGTTRFSSDGFAESR